MPPAIASFGIALVSNCFSVGNRVGQGGRGLIVDATTETPEPSVPSEVSAFQKKSSSSLIAENQFPVSARNFPVLMRREFGGNRLTYISESGASGGFEG